MMIIKNVTKDFERLAAFTKFSLINAENSD